MNLILGRKRGVVSNIPECSTCGKPSPLPNWCWGQGPFDGCTRGFRILRDGACVCGKRDGSFRRGGVGRRVYENVMF